MISIVDYGVGNVKAFLNLFDRLGIEAKRANNTNSSKIVCAKATTYAQNIKSLWT